MPVVLLVCVLWAVAVAPLAAEPQPSAAALRASYAQLADRLRDSPFQRPLYLDSEETPQDLKGDIRAEVDYPFATVAAALDKPAHWCDVLMLHLNIKYCRAAGDKADRTLTVGLGRKYDQPPADAYRIDFNYRSVAASPDYFAVELTAEKGPMSTRDYRIRLEAVPIEGGHTFLHFAYSYAFGWTGRLAMRAYLLTSGRDKVGFTVTGTQADGRPDYIRGVRAVAERNTMRYYLAIEAYLAALSAPPEDRLEKRLQLWYDGTEQYARQLHEIERGDYLEMKRNEYLRQRTAE